jgi:hypothetical protein
MGQNTTDPSLTMIRPALASIVFATVLLTGCDMLGGALGIESPEKVAAAREADGKAIGGACRHAGRAIEDCYTLNKRADKSSIFAGWRDMNDYMRENKIDAVAPQLTTQVANAGSKTAAEPDDVKASPPVDKPAQKATESGKPRNRESAKAHDS